MTIEQDSLSNYATAPLPDRGKNDLNPFPTTTPLPDGDRGNLTEKTIPEKGSVTTSRDRMRRAKALQTKDNPNFVSKQVYSDAIAAKCLECTGVNPAVTDCAGEEVNDGKPCRLYHVNTREKRFKVTKTALKKAIKNECHFCMGNWEKKENPLSGCSSPECALYPHGAGPHVAKREGRRADV